MFPKDLNWIFPLMPNVLCYVYVPILNLTLIRPTGGLVLRFCQSNGHHTVKRPLLIVTHLKPDTRSRPQFEGYILIFHIMTPSVAPSIVPVVIEAVRACWIW